MNAFEHKSGRRTALIILGILIGGSVLLGFLLDTGGTWFGDGRTLGLGRRVPTIGIIYLDGTIAGGASASGLFGVTTGSDDVVSYLKEAADDDSVKAVVLRINSPGGSAPAAQEISREIEKLKNTGKPVIASMGDVAASGAYYISAQADLIMANPGTVTGSIGAIMHISNVEELYEKVGLRDEAIKSGPHKDIGSSTRTMTEEERRLLEDLVKSVYSQFLEAVASGRGMSLDELRPLADGRVFTGSQAKEVGLVDEMGNFQDAIDVAVDFSGVSGRYRIKEYGALSPLEAFFRRLGLSAPKGLLREVFSSSASPYDYASLKMPGVLTGEPSKPALSYADLLYGGDEHLWALYYSARTMLAMPLP